LHKTRHEYSKNTKNKILKIKGWHEFTFVIPYNSHLKFLSQKIVKKIKKVLTVRNCGDTILNTTKNKWFLLSKQK